MARDLEVEGPDGQLFAFPAGTADGVMRTALMRHYQTGPGKGWQDRVPAAPDPMETPVDPGTAKVGELLTREGQMHEQGREAGSQAGALKAAAVGVRHGASANFDDEVAGLSRASGLPDWTPPLVAAPLGAARVGLDALGVTSGQASQDYADQRDYARGYHEAAADAHPVADFAGGMAGGLALPVGAAGTAARLPGAIVRGGAAGAAYGGLAGAGAGEGDLADRAASAAKAGGIGAALGGALPVVGAAAAPLVAPIVSNIAARVNPAAYAERQIGRAMERSGQTADEVGDRIAQAAAEGQSEYRLLDALDYPGARLGAVVSKNPGEGRTQLREFLNDRQQGQSYRLSNALAEGLGAPETAQAAAGRMTAARRQIDNEAFGSVRADAEPVNVTPAIEHIDRTLRPGLTGDLNLQNGIAYDSVEGALARARALLTDGRSQVADFEVVQRARGDIADAVEKAQRGGEGNKARLLRGVRDALDQQMEASSPGYRDAMGRSRAAAREVDAIEAGSTAAQRGRSEDKIGTFAAMTPGEQAAFRTGYADPLIAKVQAAAEGSNKARPFTSQAMQTELPAFAGEGRGDTLTRQIGRENEMFANRNEALGNSKTAENLADNADTGLDAGLVMKLLGGNFVGATKDALMRGAAALNGNTEAVRREMARLLMEGDRQRAVTMLVRLGQQNARRASIGTSVRRGTMVGGVQAVDGPPR